MGPIWRGWWGQNLFPEYRHKGTCCPTMKQKGPLSLWKRFFTSSIPASMCQNRSSPTTVVPPQNHWRPTRER
jgi:hypothetical protein